MRDNEGTVQTLGLLIGAPRCEWDGPENRCGSRAPSPESRCDEWMHINQSCSNWGVFRNVHDVAFVNADEPLLES